MLGTGCDRIVGTAPISGGIKESCPDSFFMTTGILYGEWWGNVTKQLWTQRPQGRGEIGCSTMTQETLDEVYIFVEPFKNDGLVSRQELEFGSTALQIQRSLFNSPDALTAGSLKFLDILGQ